MHEELSDNDKVIKWESLVLKETKKYQNSNFYEDLQQECRMAVLKAYEKHDPEAGGSFTGWMAQYIRWEIGTFMRNVSNTLEDRQYRCGYDKYRGKDNPRVIRVSEGESISGELVDIFELTVLDDYYPSGEDLYKIEQRRKFILRHTLPKYKEAVLAVLTGLYGNISETSRALSIEHSTLAAEMRRIPNRVAKGLVYE